MSTLQRQIRLATSYIRQEELTVIPLSYSYHPPLPIEKSRLSPIQSVSLHLSLSKTNFVHSCLLITDCESDLSWVIPPNKVFEQSWTELVRAVGPTCWFVWILQFILAFGFCFWFGTWLHVYDIMVYCLTPMQQSVTINMVLVWFGSYWKSLFM